MNKKIMSFAQGEEDLILFNFLDEVEKGFYVDVGANDPWVGSVTKLFYDLGWSGINVEPLPDMYEELCKDRSRDINVNMGAGSNEDELVFYVAGGLSTFDKDTSDKMVLGSVENKISVKIKTLTDIILENIDINNTEIHFCKIDVENFEKEVLLGIDFNLIRPWIFCIESTEPYTNINTHDQWENILFDNDYYLLTHEGVNRYYADKSKKKLFENKKTEDLNEKYDIFIALEKKSKLYNIINFVRKNLIFFTDLYYKIRFMKF